MKVNLLSVIKLETADEMYNEDTEIEEVTKTECDIFNSEIISLNEVLDVNTQGLQSTVNKLLALHCFNCDGEMYGCNGCTIENQILEILTK